MIFTQSVRTAHQYCGESQANIGPVLELRQSILGQYWASRVFPRGMPWWLHTDQKGPFNADFHK